MEFESYNIKRIADNSNVRLVELDPLVCRELNLEYSEKDYGHFRFPERENENVGGQKSVSWAGLLHVIAYYSRIKHGKCSAYDVESAMAWVCHFAVTFPPSAIDFTSELMKFLERHGLYVYIDLMREDAQEVEFLTDCHGNKIFRNECGVFECCRAFNAVKFSPDNGNLLNRPIIKDCNRNYDYSNDTYYSPSIRSLIIPEGIRIIEPEFFRGGYVEDPVSLPHSLVELAGFNDSCLSEMAIPKNVRIVRSAAFQNSKIKKLTISRITDCKFEDFAFSRSEIENLYIPEREMLQATELPFIHCAKEIFFY